MKALDKALDERLNDRRGEQHDRAGEQQIAMALAIADDQQRNANNEQCSDYINHDLSRSGATNARISDGRSASAGMKRQARCQRKAQMILSTLAASDESHADADESYADTTKGNLLTEVCRDEKHAGSHNEEIAAAL
jgi:hypothetical protein